ncbi:hypothetical protein CW306_09895 [Bacillus sp. BA3]|nr:hypothetical protein CW306_09895 [Bacillus sp. BA3]
MAYLSFYTVFSRKMKRDFVIQQIVESVLKNWKTIQPYLGKAGLDGKSGKIKNVEFRRLIVLFKCCRNNFGARGEKGELSW